MRQRAEAEFTCVHHLCWGQQHRQSGRSRIPSPGANMRLFQSLVPVGEESSLSACTTKSCLHLLQQQSLGQRQKRWVKVKEHVSLQEIEMQEILLMADDALQGKAMIIALLFKQLYLCISGPKTPLQLHRSYWVNWMRPAKQKAAWIPKWRGELSPDVTSR